MKSKNLVLNALYPLAAILLFVSVGFNIYQYQKIKRLSVSNGLAEINSVDKFKKINSINELDSSYLIKNQTDKKSTSPEINKGRSSINEVQELEYQLNSAEDEADMAYAQLSDELTEKKDFKKAMKILHSTTSDSIRKSSSEASAIRLADDYNPLYKKLDISEEKFEELKDLIAQKHMELSSSSISFDASAEEKKQANKSWRDISETYENKIRELLGEEQYSTYSLYNMKLTYYRDLSEFVETIPPENRLSEDQENFLVESMYDGNIAASAENPITRPYESYSQQEIMERSLKITKLANEKYVQASSSVLSPEQIELYKAYLQKKVDRLESSMKISEYLYGK